MKKEPTYKKPSVESIEKYLDVHDELKKGLGREPLVAELATEMGCSEARIRELHAFTLDESEQETDEFSVRFRMTAKNHKMEELRKAKGLKQDDLAAMIGIGSATISQIECLRAYPNPEQKRKISEALGAPEYVLFPEWIEIYSRKWNKGERSKVVVMKQAQLDSPEVLALPSQVIDPAEEADNSMRSEIIKELISHLLPREQLILELKYGLNGDRPATLEEIGNAIDVSRERVRQIEIRAIDKLSRFPGFEKLKDMF